MNRKLRSIAGLLSAVSLICIGGARAASGQTLRSADPHAGSPANPSATVSAVPSDEAGKQPGSQFKLGIGDVIHISVWRESELTETAVIRPDGKISLPLAGELQIAGETTSTAEAIIRSHLLEYVTEPRVSVSVAEIHSRQVFITGQVLKPGAYPLLESCSVLQLIASAGGLTSYAHKKHVTILDANNRPVAEFNYARAIKGETPQIRMLQPGDTVVVP